MFVSRNLLPSHFKNVLKRIKEQFHSQIGNTYDTYDQDFKSVEKITMSGNTDIWEIDREFSIVLDNLLELEHEKLQNSILEKSVFGSVTPRRGDGEGASPSVVLAAAFTRESLPPGSEVLQKVMQDIRSHPYNS